MPRVLDGIVKIRRGCAPVSHSVDDSFHDISVADIEEVAAGRAKCEELMAGKTLDHVSAAEQDGRGLKAILKHLTAIIMCWSSIGRSTSILISMHESLE